MATAKILDTNTTNAVTSVLLLTTETVISLFVCKKTGGTGKFRVGLEVSPDDGTTWIPLGGTLSGDGIITEVCAATQARAKVLVIQGEVSTVSVFLEAK